MSGWKNGRLARFFGTSDGNATLEFVFLFPIVLALLLVAFETGFLALRQTMLTRGLDMAVRDLRLATPESVPDYDALRSRICEAALIVPRCEAALRVEMRRIDPGVMDLPAGPPACIDHAETIDPANSYVPGVENELMLVRACVLFDPVFPAAGLGRRLADNARGRCGIHASAAFVNEPAL